MALGKKDEEALNFIQSFPDSGKKVFRAVLMGVHLNIYRHMQGMSTLVIYAGLILSQENTTIAPYTNFYLNVIYFFMTLIAVFLTLRLFGRRFLLIYSSFAFTVCNIMIMVGMLTDIAVLTLVWIVLLMATYGIAYSVISETYPAEILRPDQNIYVSLISWPALIFCTILPPVFSDITASRRPWPMFLIFAIYSLLSTIYLWFCAVESKGKRYI
jgi:MFS family permease